MNKHRRQRGFTAVEAVLIVLAVVIVGAAGFAVAAHLHTATPNTASGATCSLKNVPAKFCERAKKTGYYCPSWAAKPGAAAPDICYKVQPVTIQPDTAPQQCGCREFNNCAPQSACEGQSTPAKSAN